jgi:rhodanese-related sulfurtransferase
MKRVLILLIAVTLVTYSCKEGNASNEIQVVTPEEMQELSELEDVQLLDVRTPEEYKEGYIADFQNIDYLSPSFEKEIEKLDKSKPVIVYCKSGNRSGKCAAKMKEKGFIKVYDLDGGIAKWKFNGYDLKTKSLP